jgi:hypothetical protein
LTPSLFELVPHDRERDIAIARRTLPAGVFSYSGMTGAVSTALANPVGVARGSTMVRPMPNGGDLAGRRLAPGSGRAPRSVRQKIFNPVTIHPKISVCTLGGPL